MDKLWSRHKVGLVDLNIGLYIFRIPEFTSLLCI